MNRREFLNTLGTAVLGAGAGIAVASVMFAIPAQGKQHFCNLCGSVMLTMGCSNSACEASNVPDRATRSRHVVRKMQFETTEPKRGPVTITPPEQPNFPTKP